MDLSKSSCCCNDDEDVRSGRMFSRAGFVAPWLALLLVIIPMVVMMVM